MKIPKAGTVLLVASLLPASVWMACSHRGTVSGLKNIPSRACQDPEELSDVLAKFANAVSHRDYFLAVSYLSKEDQARMLDSAGAVPPEIRRKLNALNFSGLTNNPKIDLVSGRLTGIFDCLPCLDESDAPPTVSRKPEKEPDSAGKRDPGEERRQELARAFFGNIQREDWRGVTGLIHPQEREALLHGRTEFTELDYDRFRSVQECDLDALTLRDDWLVGVSILMSPPVTALWLRSKELFDRIDAGKFEEAVSMLVESEKMRFLDSRGELRADRVALLKNLDRSQWRKFYLRGDYLMGVSEAVLGYKNL